MSTDDPEAQYQALMRSHASLEYHAPPLCGACEEDPQGPCDVHMDEEPLVEHLMEADEHMALAYMDEGPLPP